MRARESEMLTRTRGNTLLPLIRGGCLERLEPRTLPFTPSPLFEIPTSKCFPQSFGIWRISGKLQLTLSQEKSKLQLPRRVRAESRRDKVPPPTPTQRMKGPALPNGLPPLKGSYN